MNAKLLPLSIFAALALVGAGLWLLLLEPEALDGAQAGGSATALESQGAVMEAAPSDSGSPLPDGPLVSEAYQPDDSTNQEPEDPALEAVTWVGRIVDAQARPIEGAWLTAGSSSDLARVSRMLFSGLGTVETPHAVTDRRGRFRLVTKVRRSARQARVEVFVAGPQHLQSRASFQRSPRSSASLVEVQDITLARGALLRGRVVNSEGRGIGNVPIRAALAQNGISFGPGSYLDGERWARSASDGSFSIAGFPTATSLTLQAHPADARPSEPSPWSLRGGESDAQAEALLTLPGGTPLLGTVVDALGQPVAGAKLRFVGREERLWTRYRLPQAPNPIISWSSAESAADGSFRFPALPPLPWMIVTHAPGHATTTWESDVRPDGPLRLRMEAPITIKGRVRFDGEAVALAKDPELKITITGTFGPLFDSTIPANDASQFFIGEEASKQLGEDPDPGRFLITGYSGEDRTTIAIATSEYATGKRLIMLSSTEKHLDLMVDLQPTTHLSGRVSDQAGQPIAGASVQLEASTRDASMLSFFDLEHGATRVTSPDRFSRTVTTNADGHYSISGMPAGEYVLRASEANHQPSEEKLSIASEDGHVIPVGLAPLKRDLVLQRGAHLQVMVRDDRGEPVPGITLRILCDAPYIPLPARVTDSLGMAVYDSLPPRLLRIEVDGAVASSSQIQMTRLGDYGGLRPQAPDRRDSRLIDLSKDPADRLGTLELVVPSPASLTVTVHGAGRPIPGLRLKIARTPDPDAPPQNSLFYTIGGVSQIETGPHGTHTFSALRAGHYTVEVQVPGIQQVQAFPFTIESGETRAAILNLPDASISGRVLSRTTGRPLIGVRVEVSPTERTHDPLRFLQLKLGGRDQPLARHSVQTDTDGHFVIPWVEASTSSQLQIDKPGYLSLQTDPFEVSSAQDTELGDIQLQEGARLEVQWTPREGPASQRTIGIVSGTSDHDERLIKAKWVATLSNTKTSHTFTELPAGHYELWLAQPSSGPTPFGVTPAHGLEKLFSLELTPGERMTHRLH